MDPVSLIVTALAAGAGSAVQDEASDAVSGVYARLRDAVGRRLAGHPDGELALARYDADPSAGQAPLAQELAKAGAGDDVDLVTGAVALIELIDRVRKYAVSASGSQGVQVGDHNVQVSYFLQEPVSGRQGGAAGGKKPAGHLLGEVTDPFALEVHRPVQADDWSSGLPVLPVYVPRDHDRRLAEVVRGAAEGASGIAVLVGGSSTGKTRACWEALRLLRDRPKPWRLWHPIDPSRPEAALRELPSIGPRTVIWLNEAQFYLDASGGMGERVAAGLRELLRDPARAPVLVLATLWPQFWGRLTTRPTAGADDVHAQARELLAGRDITVPAAFTAARLRQLADATDPRLAQAAAAAEGGQVIQFLAGAPELLARYRNAPPAAAALISAAMDARRLGMGVALPRAFLRAAAPGYLTDTDWDGLGEDWLEQALAYTAASCKGVRGPVARIRPRSGLDAESERGSAYRLADFLEQHGRRARRAYLPTEEFWTAAARYAAPGDLPALARAAEDRGLLRDATRFRKRAATRYASEAAALVRSWYFLHPYSADSRPAQWAAAHAALDDPDAVAELLGALLGAGEQKPATVLASRAAVHVALVDPGAVVRLLDLLWGADAQEQAAALASRAAAHATLDDPDAVAELLNALWGADAQAPGAALASRAAAHVALVDPGAVARLLDALRGAGAQEQAAALASRAAAHVALDDPGAVTELLDALRGAGAQEQAAALASRVAAHVALDDPGAVTDLLDALRRAGAQEQAATLLARDPAAHVALDDPGDIGRLLDALRGARAREQAATLLARDPAAHVALDDPGAVARLLDALQGARAQEQVATLISRAAGNPRTVARLLSAMYWARYEKQTVLLTSRAAMHAALVDPGAVADLLIALRMAGAHKQASTLLARDPAAHVALVNQAAVARLLNALQGAGAQEQAAALASRAAAHVALDDPGAVADLLHALRRAGAHKQASTLLARDPAAHVALVNPGAVARLLNAVRGREQAAALLARDPAAHVALDDPGDIGRLLDALRWARAREQAAALLARDPAAHVAMDDPGAVARLLDALREAGAREQAAALASRAAVHVALDDPDALARLLDALEANDQATALVERLPAEGQYARFRERADSQMRYRFGREFDGRPALPWHWEDVT